MEFPHSTIGPGASSPSPKARAAPGLFSAHRPTESQILELLRYLLTEAGMGYRFVPDPPATGR
jgi:hypothetical protein